MMTNVVIRFKDSNGVTRYLLRIPGEDLPPNANMSHPVTFSLTVERENHISVCPEEVVLTAEIPPWGNQHEQV